MKSESMAWLSTISMVRVIVPTLSNSDAHFFLVQTPSFVRGRRCGMSIREQSYTLQVYRKH